MAAVFFENLWGRRLHVLLWLAAAFAILFAQAAASAQDKASETELVKVSLTSDKKTVQPGGQCTLYLQFSIAPGYHIYAPDPGEIGQPASAGWKFPSGISVRSEKWPEPEAAEQDGFKSNIYSGRAAVEAVVDISADVPPGETLIVAAHPSWLVCGTLCVPGETEVALSLPVAEKESAVSSAPVNSSSASWQEGLPAAIGLAFLGGLILNLMPCVFPVLSIKALELVHASQADLQTQRRRAWSYSAGVVVSFWLAALSLNVLRAFGHRLGWGFQMQSPYFVISAAYVFVALAFNLLGFYEIGLGFTRLGDGGSQARGSFASGVLAVVVATPCTAPFMGAALGYAFTVPWYENLLIFTALGCGLALPLLLLAFWPAWQRLLPRPGSWMVTLRQALAFPLLLTAVYFVWIIEVQAGPYVSAAVLSGWVALGAAVWLYGRWGQYGSRGLSILALLLALGGWSAGGIAFYCQVQRTISTVDPTPAAGNTAAESAVWQPWNPQAAEKAAAEGRKVFVDFGASWCLTCQVNERAVLNQKRVLDAFAKHRVLLLKADWTNNDPQITQALEQFGRSGVPLYVYYNGNPGQAPQVLPEVITADMIVNMLERESDD